MCEGEEQRDGQELLWSNCKHAAKEIELHGKNARNLAWDLLSTRVCISPSRNPKPKFTRSTRNFVQGALGSQRIWVFFTGRVVGLQLDPQVTLCLCLHLLPVCDDHFLWTLSLSLSPQPVVGGVHNVEKQMPVWFCSPSHSHVGCMILWEGGCLIFVIYYCSIGGLLWVFQNPKP